MQSIRPKKPQTPCFHFLSPDSIIMARKTSIAAQEISEHTIQTQNNVAVSQKLHQPFDPPSKTTLLHTISSEMKDCMLCPLSETRKNIVIGEGNPCARLVLVGEAPGEQEDLHGRPFVGRAGQLLDKMLQAIHLNRSQVYILNVIKCRPPYNRLPEKNEIQTCMPFLKKQITAIAPEVILTLGKVASQTLLEKEEKISQLRGNLFPYGNAKLLPTFHPAYLLRNPSAKKDAWRDLQKVAHLLGIHIPNPEKNDSQTIQSTE